MSSKDPAKEAPVRGGVLCRPAEGSVLGSLGCILFPLVHLLLELFCLLLVDERQSS